MFSCKQDNNIKTQKDIFYIKKLKQKIVDFGKEEDYYELENYYLYHPKESHEMLSYTLLMINKFGKKNFYHKIYSNYVCLKNNGAFVPYYFSNFEEHEKKFILHYLQEGLKISILFMN